MRGFAVRLSGQKRTGAGLAGDLAGERRTYPGGAAGGRGAAFLSPLRTRKIKKAPT